MGSRLGVHRFAGLALTPRPAGAIVAAGLGHLPECRLIVTRRPAFTQAQLRTAAKIAKEHGVSIRLEADGSITISPSSTPTTDDELDRELEAFERHVPWPGPHLNHREERVLQVLVEGNGHAMAADAIPLAGPRTVNGLVSYGLVGLEDSAETFDRHQKIHATKEGLSFFSRRNAHYRRYPSL